MSNPVHCGTSLTAALRAFDNNGDVFIGASKALIWFWFLSPSEVEMIGLVVIGSFVLLVSLYERSLAPVKQKVVRYSVLWEQRVLDSILAGEWNKVDRRRRCRDHWLRRCHQLNIH